ncbi:Fe2OG dioxygenase domain-containing protein [Psidium guajava]|nr:Fe2OG dioxygenase domain-containing protein [Psidium guajava]
MIVSSKKNIALSVNRRRDKVGQLLLNLIPFNEPSSTPLYKRDDKTLAKIMNKYGDSGSPCLMPWEG